MRTEVKLQSVSTHFPANPKCWTLMAIMHLYVSGCCNVVLMIFISEAVTWQTPPFLLGQFVFEECITVTCSSLLLFYLLYCWHQMGGVCLMLPIIVLFLMANQKKQKHNEVCQIKKGDCILSWFSYPDGRLHSSGWNDSPVSTGQLWPITNHPNSDLHLQPVSYYT